MPFRIGRQTTLSNKETYNKDRLHTKDNENVGDEM